MRHEFILQNMVGSIFWKEAVPTDIKLSVPSCTIQLVMLSKEEMQELRGKYNAPKSTVVGVPVFWSMNGETIEFYPVPDRDWNVITDCL